MDEIVKDRKPIEELIPAERVALYRNDEMGQLPTRSIGRDLAAISSEANLMRLFERLATDPTIPLDRIETLMTMQRELRAETAQNAFMAAMAEAQSEMRVVIADKSNSQTRSKYASYAALDSAVRPIYTKHGFCVTFDTDDCPKPDHIRVIADCSNAGFIRRYHLDIPCDGKGAKGGDVMTKTHAVMSATSYGKRGLLILIFNIPVADKWDDDGNAASRQSGANDSISDEEADLLRNLALEAKADMPKFLEFFKAESISDIARGDFEKARRALEAKRNKALRETAGEH